ncbi:MAG: hypothetical protein J5808_02260 [Paludibacteraceae bacterium]|nr:hypothetical protein [Paludibacteraceae bacterium]
MNPTTENNPKKKESPLLSILFSIVIPAVILSKFSKPEYLGVLPGFLIALAFPIGLALYNFLIRKEVGFIAVLGFVSIFLTGIIGVFEFDPKWIAVKEAAVPLLIAIAVVVSLYTPYPLIRKLIYNDTLLDLPFIEQRLDERGTRDSLEKAMRTATWLVALSFLVSSILNYVVAKIVVTATPGTELFNEQLGKLTAISYPVIALPSTLVMLVALFYLLRKLKTLTGETDLDNLLSAELKEKSK